VAGKNYGAAGQTMTIGEALRVQELHAMELQELQAKLKTFEPSTGDRSRLYESVLIWATGLTDGLIKMELAPLVKEKLGVDFETLMRDVKARRKQSTPPENGRTEQKSKRPAHWPERLIHPAIDFDLHTGFASVGILRPGGYGVMAYHPQTGAVWFPINSVADFMSVKPFEYLAFMSRWSEGDLKAFLLMQTTTPFSEVFALLVDLIRTHIEISEPCVAFEATYILATYFFLAFSSFPRQHINGEPGSGKSKLQEIISGTAFNGLLRINPTLASLFRIIQVYRPTFCLDEMDTLSADDKRELLGLLNSGYKRGGAIDRCEGDQNIPVNYEIYCPISLSGVKGLNPTTADRSIYIPMRRGCDRAKLNTDIAADEFTMTKVRGIGYRLALMRTSAVVQTLDTLNLPDWLNGRDRELWKPLLAIAFLIDNEADLGVVRDLLELAKQSVSEREGLTPEAQEVLSIIEARLTGEWIEMRPAEIAPVLADRLGVNDITPQKVGHILKRLGFIKLPRDHDGMRYRVEAAKVQDIQKRYGGVELESSA